MGTQKTKATNKQKTTTAKKRKKKINKQTTTTKNLKAVRRTPRVFFSPLPTLLGSEYF